MATLPHGMSAFRPDLSGTFLAVCDEFPFSHHAVAAGQEHMPSSFSRLLPTALVGC